MASDRARWAFGLSRKAIWVTAISYHDSVNDLQGLKWAENGPFARLAWFRLLENAGTRPFLAFARDGDTALALPLHRADKHAEAMTNWYAFTWQVLHTGDVPDDTLVTLARDLGSRIKRLDLQKIPEEGGAVRRLAKAFRQAGWTVFEDPCDTNHILRVDGRSYADYLASRPGPVRTTLKRKAKKVDVTLSDRFDPQDWAAYEAIYAESWKPEEGDPDLLRAFARQESKAGRYRFGIARHNGEPVAAQFWTVDGGTAYIHKLAHRESAKPLSPGTTLTAALFERVIDIDKVSLVDFGTGDDPYKRDWMEEQRTRWHLTCLRPGAPRNWPALARGYARKLVRGKSGG